MATTPPSSDPQVPGNYPGTVQNPTQVPAPVNPVTNPEVPPLPNDVDPNFIPNPAPVNNTIDPEVPQPEENFPRKKRFDAEPVVPVTNPEVPQPQDSFPEEGIDFPAAPPAGVDPQISQPDSFPEEGIDLPQALPPAEPAANNTGFDDFYGDQTYTATGTGTADATPVAPANTGFDDYYGEQTYTTNYTGTADVPAGNTGFDDFYGEQTYTVNYTGTADTVPAGNTGFDDFYGDQTYTANFTGTADARPVIPATNSQVPNLFSSISSLLSSLFGIRPTVVSPAANPQVAQAFSVPAPTVFKPTPIPASTTTPTTTTTTNNSSGFGDFYGEQTYTANYTGTADAVPATNTGFDDFYGEQTYTANYTGTADAVPAANTGFDDFYGEQTYTANLTGTADATPVSPASNPEVPQPTPPAPTAESIVNQANPDLAQERFALKIQIERELQPQIARELQEQNPTWSPSRVFATSKLRAGAQADAAVDFRLDQQITAASQNPPTVTPEANPEVPQPTQEFSGRKKADPDIVDSPSEPAVQAQAETRIDGPVNQALLQQSNPAVATDYKSYVVDTQNKIVEQQTRELEASQGYPASENQIAVINGEAFGTATIAANVRFKNQIESADAAQSVPANTPPPTIAPADVNVPALPNDVDPNYIPNPGPVDNTIEPQAAQVDEALVAAREIDPNFIPLNDVSATTNPQVPSSANTRVENVNQSALAQKDPALYRQWQDTFAARTEQNIARTIAAEEAVQGRPINAEDKALIVKVETFKARNETNAIYQDELQKVNAVTTVPANTPPPTVAAASVSTESNAQVPNTPTKVVAVSTETLLQNDPTTAQEYTAFKNETAAQLTEQRIAEREAVEGGPISVSEQVQIAARAEIDATADANFRYQDQIQAAGAGTVVPVDTPPPTVTAPAVSTESNPQVVVPPTRVVAVSTETLLQNDPETAQEYTAFKNETAAQLTEQRIAEREAVEGGPISVSEQVQIAARAEIDATADANFRYQDQIQAAGAGTVVPVDTPPPTVTAPAVSAATNPQVPPAQDLGSEPPIDLPQAPPANVDPQIPSAQDLGSEPPIDLPQAPPSTVDPQIPSAQDLGSEPPTVSPVTPSPTPYERFLAEENAASDAAQAAATARFNAQFDDGGNIIGSADDPQVNQGDVTDVGEFQAEPPPIPDIDTGYEDFYGNEEDVGEFQAEPVDIPNIDTGYDEFYGDDTGEFQDLSLEPDAVGSDDTGFSDFSDTGGGDGGDFFGGLFGGVKRSAGAVSGGSDPFAGILDGLFGDGPTKPNPKTTLSPAQLAANRQKAAKALAKQQNIIDQQRKQANDGDWRVRLRLAGSADYLYNAPSPGILAPLSKSGSDGVIFPYTPTITTAYQAKYNAYELTHSNYKGYFYQGSSVGDISINATFTAQDTQEANYLLAVIHFFRSVTKMFYGQDDAAHRGAPPPLVFLQGLGEYQFNRHPCVVTNFNYTLPADVDYIRALSPNNDGTNLSNRRSLQSGVTPFINPSSSRLQNAGLPQGGLYTPPAPPSLGTNSPTYVPTKMDIQLTLLAIQTRSQVSKQFSLKGFANGNLIKGGFW